MKAYILPSGICLQPFGDPVAVSMIGNRSLAEHQQRALEGAGLEVRRIARPEEIEDAHFVLSYDNVFFTRRILDSLVKRARQQGGSIRCGLPRGSLLVHKTQALQDLDFGEGDGEALALYRLYLVEAAQPPRNDEQLGRVLAAARPVRARFLEKVYEVPSPRNITGASAYRHPITSSVVMQIRHWVHVLWANQLSIQIQWIEDLLQHRMWALWKLLGAGAGSMLRGRFRKSALKWSVLQRMNRIGRGCDIHPTAQLEFSRLEDGVRVGAYTLIRGSIIGAKTVIEDRANVLYSVVGPGSFMSRNASMALCAGYPGGNLSIRGVQCSLFGRDCAMTSAAQVIDLKAQGDIQVQDQGTLRSVGTNFLGACFGHRSFAGMGVTVQAGREIPNGAMLVMPPDAILQKIPEDLPPGVPAWAHQGSAVTGSGS